MNNTEKKNNKYILAYSLLFLIPLLVLLLKDNSFSQGFVFFLNL